MRILGMVVAAAAASLATASAAHADCALVVLGPEPITRAGAKIPADGGVLVGTGVASERTPSKGDPSQVKYKATAGSKTVSLVTASLAPGLTVYRPKPAMTGALTLQAGKTKLAVTFDKAKGAALHAPDATAVTVTSSPSLRGGASVSVSVAVASVPDAAAALVVYQIKDEEHVPISYGVPAHDKTGATTVIVYRSGGHCAVPDVPNQAAPVAGDDVVLAWADAYGRLSPVSAPVHVQ